MNFNMLTSKFMNIFLLTAILLMVNLPFSAPEAYALKAGDSIHSYFLAYAKVLGAKLNADRLNLLNDLVEKLRAAPSLPAIKEAVLPLVENSVSTSQSTPIKELLAECLALRAKTELRDRPERALEDSQDALRLSPSNPEIRLYRALVLEKVGKKREAMQELDKAVNLKPSWYKLFEERARLLRENGMVEAANSDSKLAATLRASEKAKTTELSKQAFEGNNHEARMEALQRLLKLYPRNTRYIALYSQMLLENLDHEAAIAWAEYAKALDPSECLVYNIIAIALIDTSRSAQALKVADEGVRLFPYSPVTLTNRAYVLHQMGENKKALLDINRAIEKHPSYGSAYMIRSKIAIALNLGETAISDAATYCRYEPKNPDAFVQLASILTGKGRLEEAYKLLSEKLNLSAEGTSSRFNMHLVLGKTASILGKRQIARRHFEAANKTTTLAGYANKEITVCKDYQDMAIQYSYILIPRRVANLEDLESLSQFGYQNSPEHEQATYLNALVLMCRGEYAKASSLFTRICEKREWQGRVSCHAGLLAFLCLERAGNLKLGKVVLEKLQKDTNLSRSNRALIAFFLGQSSLSECLSKAGNRATEIRAKTLVAFHLASQKNTKEAVPLLLEVKEREENYIDESLIAVYELKRLALSKP